MRAAGCNPGKNNAGQVHNPDRMAGNNSRWSLHIEEADRMETTEITLEIGNKNYTMRARIMASGANYELVTAHQERAVGCLVEGLLTQEEIWETYGVKEIREVINKWQL